MSDPLPQAMILTAIVITLGMTAFLLAMAYRSWLLVGHDEVQDDVEDRRIVAARRTGRGPGHPTATTATAPTATRPERRRQRDGAAVDDRLSSRCRWSCRCWARR